MKIILNFLVTLRSLIRYNLKIIFVNRFIWFMLAAFLFYAFIVFMQLWNNDTTDEAFIYNALIFPGILLLFFPTVFGIQTDKDARILEILFGIPDYRYKVWLVRIVMIFLLVFIFLLVISLLSSFGLVRINAFEMAGQLMLPLLFFGSMAFMISTLVKSGYGTAVILIILGLFILILAEPLETSMWNVFLNPFQIPDNLNEIVWQNITFKNRVFLGSSIAVFLLYGLFNLQRREGFMN
jgi:hypothetical protein